ncbi:DDE_3 domain-containing protein [Trichonephila clavipes]|nr:DDE_3 domain-containing protein [Trichonephila clavipes]
MEWLARSPDLNPIEHFWDNLGREVAALNPPPRSLHELKQGLLCVWSSLPIPVAAQLPGRSVSRFHATGSGVQILGLARPTQPSIPSMGRQMSTKFAWELNTGGRLTNHLDGTSAHAPQCPRSLKLRWTQDRERGVMTVPRVPTCGIGAAVFSCILERILYRNSINLSDWSRVSGRISSHGVGTRHPFRWGKRRTQQISFVVNNNRADIKITVAIPRDRRPPITIDGTHLLQRLSFFWYV